jgi:hypothetical protein
MFPVYNYNMLIRGVGKDKKQRQKTRHEVSMVAYSCNPKTWEAGELIVWVQSGLPSETLSQNKTKQNKPTTRHIGKDDCHIMSPECNKTLHFFLKDNEVQIRTLQHESSH